MTLDAGESHIFLMSRTSLQDFLSFMTSWAVDAQTHDKQVLSDQWRAAHEAMKKLRRQEPTWADRPAVQPLPDNLAPLVKKVQSDPIYRKAVAETPSRLGIVELDRIVVCQKLVSRAHIDRLRHQLGPQPAPEQIFQFCLPSAEQRLPIRAGRIGDEEFAFISESNDLRFLDAVLLQPEQVVGYEPEGPIAAILGFVVGYSANYLTVLDVDGRLVLHNGNHRACTLRDMGLTHAPCVIQKITNEDELQLLAPAPVRRNPDYYLKQARPPVLKDYFNPDLTLLAKVALTTREIRIRYSVDERDTP